MKIDVNLIVNFNTGKIPRMNGHSQGREVNVIVKYIGVFYLLFYTSGRLPDLNYE